MQKIIEKHLIPSTDFIYGFAYLHGLLNDKFVGFNYGISIGKRLDNEIIDELEDGPTLKYFNHYHQVNSELAELIRKIQADLTEVGLNSIIIEPTISTGSPEYEKYLETLSYDISHKMVATRAGLGWIGKTDLFISKKFGPRLRLCSILLDKDPGVKAIPIEKSKCGKCDLCVVKCPASSSNGKLWNIHVHRDEFFNAHKCREKCAELTWEKLKVAERICGLCVQVCPIGKRKLN